MAGNDSLHEEDVLSFLGKARRPATVREIASGLSLRHAGRRALGGVLSRLKRQRLVEELRGGQYRLVGDRPRQPDNTRSSAKPAASSKSVTSTRDPNLLTGRLAAHRDGYGFVVP